MRFSIIMRLFEIYQNNEEFITISAYGLLLCLFCCSLQHLLTSLQVITLQPLYNTVCYNMVLDITRFKDGSQKCIDYIEK